MTSVINPIDGWERYPCCLPDSFYDADRLGRSRLLELEACRLFSGRDEVAVWNYEQSKQSRSRGSQESINGVDIVTGEDDMYFNICHLAMYYSPDDLKSPSDNQGYEFCYILRRYEIHGRPSLKQSWSLRQMAVYQKFDFQTRKQGLLPLVYTFSQQLFRDLTNHQVEKATYSSLKTGETDYEANFTDNQRLRKVCEDLTTVQIILDANEDIARAIRRQCRDLQRQKTDFGAPDVEILSRVALDVQRIQGFKRTARALFKQAEGTSQLVNLK
ncbi:MAG: hypothetical protein Q9187_002826 [Circinaria calcarea]